MRNNLTRKIIFGLLALALLSPLGLILPKAFHAGPAWGEWSSEEVSKDKGFTPEGMKKNEKVWNAPLAGYSPHKEERSLWHASGYYILSGILGMAVIGLLTYLLTKFFPGK
jgi:hypothetical protein